MFDEVIKKEEIYYAVSMLPGILIAIYWYLTSEIKDNKYKLLFFSYIITCICSFIYHLKKSIYDDDLDTKWYRLDIIGQQFTLYVSILLSRHGFRGIIALSPLFVATYLANFSDKSECLIGTIAHALSILIGSFAQNIYAVIRWLFSFIIYSLKDFYPNKYSHILWHILCHRNITKNWQYLYDDILLKLY